MSDFSIGFSIQIEPPGWHNKEDKKLPQNVSDSKTDESY